MQDNMSLASELSGTIIIRLRRAPHGNLSQQANQKIVCNDAAFVIASFASNYSITIEETSNSAAQPHTVITSPLCLW